jgi:hypothetical protein
MKPRATARSAGQLRPLVALRLPLPPGRATRCSEDATSTSGALKRLGYARWKPLHRLAYVAPILGVIHFTWRVKKDVREPVAYAVVLGALLLFRVATSWRARTTSSSPSQRRPAS